MCLSREKIKIQELKNSGQKETVSAERHTKPLETTWEQLKKKKARDLSGEKLKY